MKKSHSRKNTILLIMTIIGTTMISACNRGTGCPNQFDMQPIFSLFGL